MGADITAANIHDSSAYHLACLNGNDQILKELLYTHNITMKVNSKGYHPIHYAAGCKRGQFCLEFLISLNVDVNLASFIDGRTPLHVAALQGRTSCAQILYSNGKYFLLTRQCPKNFFSKEFFLLDRCFNKCKRL